MCEFKLEEAKDVIQSVYNEFIINKSNNIGDIKQSIIYLNNLFDNPDKILNNNTCSKRL